MENHNEHYNGFIIRIRKSSIFGKTFEYLIFIANYPIPGKYKRVRGMSGYKSPEEALAKGKKYIDENGFKVKEKYESAI